MIPPSLELRVATPRRCIGRAGGHLLVTAAMALPGCGLLPARETAPALLPAMSVAAPMDPGSLATTPPVGEPLPLIESPDVIPAGCPAARPLRPTETVWDRDRQLEAAADEMRALRDQTRTLEQRMAENSRTIAEATVVHEGEQRRIAALESQVARQTVLLEELKAGAERQQQETWHALDAISEALERVLQENAAPRPLPIASPYPTHEGIRR